MGSTDSLDSKPSDDKDMTGDGKVSKHNQAIQHFQGYEAGEEENKMCAFI